MKTKTKSVSLALVTNDVTQSVKSFQLSKNYINRFLKIGTLNIIYRRIDIPESELETKKYENVPYMVFKRKATNKFIRNYHVFTLGILDALEKDYLKEVFMYIIDKQTNDILETYNFKVKYNKEATKSDQKSSKVKSATIEFLEALASIPGNKWSPEEVQLSLEISYNDDTPQAYEPPNFEATVDPLCVSIYSEKIVTLGRVNTGFHKVSAWGRGKNFIDSRASTPVAPPILIEDDIENDEENEIPQKDGEKKRNDKFQYEAAKKKLKIGHPDTNDTTYIDITNGETNMENVSLPSSDDYVSCMCKWALSKDFETTRCTKCYGIVHLACHGFTSLSAVDESTFKCYPCSDPKLSKSSSMNMLIKLRIILYGIYIKKELPYELQLSSKEERDYILGQLDKLGVYSSKAKSIRDIKLTALNKAILTAFATENSQYLE